MKRSQRYFVCILILWLFTLSITGQVQRVEAIGITVGEMERSIKFYSEVLGFEKIADEE